MEYHAGNVEGICRLVKVNNDNEEQIIKIVTDIFI